MAPRLRRRPRAAPGLGDRDRPTRQTRWPGEDPAPPVEDVVITDRAEDFVQYVFDQVAERQRAEEAFYGTLDYDTGEVT